MSSGHKFEIVASPEGRGSVTVDGAVIPYVSKATLVIAPGKNATRLYLEIVALDGVTVKGEGEVQKTMSGT